jgi:hypothetical protein
MQMSWKFAVTIMIYYWPRGNPVNVEFFYDDDSR